MYKRKTEEDLDCGLYVTMKVLGAKWKPCIIDAIGRGACRPSEIHKQITSTSPRVLDMQLRELLDFNVVERDIKVGYPLYVEYRLTPFGESILPLLKQMAAWGEENKQFVKSRIQRISEAGRGENLTQFSSVQGAKEEVGTNSVCLPTNR
jgi:DNA-binding HxlR family transcriptional regulator